MAVSFRFGLILCLLLVIGVFFAGCSDDSSETAVTTAPTTAPAAKFAAGDIIAKSPSGGESQLYVIRSYDAAKDEYERAWIYKNADGSWGHFIDTRSERSARTIVEKVYTTKVAHVTISAVPVVTTTIPTPVVTAVSGAVPVVSAISPNSAAKDATVSVTITGTNFESGAVPKLLLPGSQPVPATGVSASSTSISCTFNLYNQDKGSYNVVVTNPGGQSGTLQRGFTVGEAAPIITAVSPSTSPMNETLGLVLTGQNFKEGVKVVLLKGTVELPCTSATVTAGTRISCDLDLYTKRNSQISAGDWDVKAINIEGAASGVWTKKFTITNATQSSTEDD